MKYCPALAALLVASLIWPATSIAQIYKYKDKNGRWVYTDKKPGSNKKAEVVGQQKSGESSGSSNTVKGDLKQQLENKYSTRSPELKASLAVVTVHTNSGFGSGFFVSDNGYLITNKHVVRPKAHSGWKQQEQELEREERNLERKFSYLKDEKSRIATNEQRLREMKKSVESPDLYRNPVTREEYETHMANHKQRQKDYKKELAEARQQQRDFKKRQKEFTFSTSTGSIAKRFSIFLKDATELKVQLIKISKEHDLALLKLNGYRTPFLTPADYPWPRQSQEVFAIGSPQGQTNSITAGKVTTVNKGSNFDGCHHKTRQQWRPAD